MKGRTPLSRRSFLKTLALATGSGLLLPGCGEKKESVALARIEAYDLARIEAAFEKWAGPAGLPEVRGKRILLKPNCVEFDPDRPINTHPVFIRAVIRFLKSRGAAAITIGEAAGHRRDSEEIWRINGYHQIAREEKVGLIDLNFDSVLDKPFKTIRRAGTLSFLPPSRLERVALPRSVVTADLFIGLPKMKSHHWTGVTLAMKNSFGIMPGIVYGWPKNVLHWNDIQRSIIEINLSCPLDFVFLDGIEAMEGDGPLSGRKIRQNSILLGRNAVAVDATACRLMGVDPQRVPYLRLAHFHEMGPLAEANIEVRGERVQDLKKEFQLPKGFENLKSMGTAP